MLWSNPECMWQKAPEMGRVLQENRSLIGFAMASGFCIYFGNLAEQYALALAGVTIAVPVFSSCIVVLGAHPPPFYPLFLGAMLSCWVD